MALNLMLQNATSADAPIIVAAQTNHAVDQLLRHVSRFEPGFVRMGAMTKDYQIVKPRTIYELKQAIKPGKLSGGLRDSAQARMKRLTSEITAILAPLVQNEDVYTAALLKEYGIITQTQCQNLINGAKEWVSRADLTNETAIWLGDERVKANRLGPLDFGFEEVEENELDMEQLQEIEAENKISDEEDIESLRGDRVTFEERMTGRASLSLSAEAIKEGSSKPNLWNVPREHRGPIYRHFQTALKEAIRQKLSKKAEAYAEAVKDAKIGRFEVDYNYLKKAPIIGLTTTGLGKYRALLQSLRPKIVLIEEAAETLEAFATVACMRSLQQLILVGDHAQLRGSTNDHVLTGPPFFLDVSLLERMVRNKVEYSQLTVQRRMIPEIRRLLRPIYKNLEDHPTVLARDPVPGMGGVNSFFFCHRSIESSDEYMSKMNVEEANMLAYFYVYLNRNGITPSQITVLTGYQGQKRLILRKLREISPLRGSRFAVETVDSYQGEENDVILLSLVRSNRWNNIGFLSSENRTCVALSRARLGFYIFGNAPALCKSSMLWWEVIQCMVQKPCRVGFRLPLTCKNHGNVTFLEGKPPNCKIPMLNHLLMLSYVQKQSNSLR